MRELTFDEIDNVSGADMTSLLGSAGAGAGAGGAVAAAGWEGATVVVLGVTAPAWAAGALIGAAAGAALYGLYCLFN